MIEGLFQDLVVGAQYGSREFWDRFAGNGAGHLLLAN
jgi:hypothetical protein